MLKTHPLNPHGCSPVLQVFEAVSTSQLLAKLASSAVVKLIRVDLPSFFSLGCVIRNFSYFHSRELHIGSTDARGGLG
jgi:hypothetical protein